MPTIERVAQRAYITGDTYSIKDELKRAGCHWDSDRRQWWIGAAKASAVEAIVSTPASPAPSQPRPIGDDTRIVAKARYKGKTYYCPWFGQTKSGEQKARLVTLDGKIDFWTSIGDGPDAAEIVKRYQPRTHTYRGRTETRYTTLGSLREFIQDQASIRKSGSPVCGECGKPGDLVADLEDGMLKHRRCCDIEP